MDALYKIAKKINLSTKMLKFLQETRDLANKIRQLIRGKVICSITNKTQCVDSQDADQLFEDFIRLNQINCDDIENYILTLFSDNMNIIY